MRRKGTSTFLRSRILLLWTFAYIPPPSRRAIARGREAVRLSRLTGAESAQVIVTIVRGTFHAAVQVISSSKDLERWLTAIERGESAMINTLEFYTRPRSAYVMRAPKGQSASRDRIALSARSRFIAHDLRYRWRDILQVALWCQCALLYLRGSVHVIDFDATGTPFEIQAYLAPRGRADSESGLRAPALATVAFRHTAPEQRSRSGKTHIPWNRAAAHAECRSRARQATRRWECLTPA